MVAEMGEIVLRISEDGKDVVSLFSDKFSTDFLGGLKITRATDVRFNNDCKKWEVYFIQEGMVLPGRFDKRSEAIAHEIEFLNNRLDKCPL